MRILPALAVTLLLALGLPARAERLRVCLGDVANPPYRLADEQGKLLRRGLDFLFLDLLAQRTGVEMEPAFLPAKRCLLELKSGQLDAVLSISHVPEREEFGLYPMRDGQPDASLALRTQRYYWYVRRESTLRWDGRQLSGLPERVPVGAQLGYSIAGVLREQGYAVDDAVRAVEANVEKLLRGRVAALALQNSEAEGLLQRRPEWAPLLHRLEPALQERPYYLVLGRHLARSSRLSPAQWWAAMAEVRDSAEYQRADQAAHPRP
ncbi:substrate-binding periplasmic protein [Inhella sp.]|uniref:substrate-binding periplasmic protein n=1 Tax=Inhella sp. TaxID=1921806 RepID=UPI0035AEECA1